jgi:hypothetical protein
MSKRARASEYWPAATNSSICSAHGLMLSLHIELPSDAAAERSIGVVTKNNCDMAEEEVSSLMVEFVGGVSEDAVVKGNANV